MRATSRAFALARQTRFDSRGLLRVERLQRAQHDRAHQLDLAEQMRGAMLQRLERADLHAELLALAQVGERALERFFRDAEHLGREHGAAGIEHGVEHDGALVERADDVAVAHRHIAQLDRRGVVTVDRRRARDRRRRSPWRRPGTA